MGAEGVLPVECVCGVAPGKGLGAILAAFSSLLQAGGNNASPARGLQRYKLAFRLNCA
jgi:hypothetical protein